MGDIAFVVDGAVQATTLPAEHAAAIAATGPGTASTRIRLGDEEYVAVTRRLSMEGEWSAAGADDDNQALPLVVILRSRTKELEFLGPLQTALAGTALLAVLVAVLLNYGVARTVTRPVGAIIATMREMADTGDLTKRIVLPNRGPRVDEDTQLLARAFNKLTDSIARFQREAADRERLSSLGRLSTVIAHEIRNPLMIIKTSVRTLKRQSVLPAPAWVAAITKNIIEGLGGTITATSQAGAGTEMRIELPLDTVHNAAVR